MPAEPTPAAKRSAVELIKENSRQLRGTLADELAKDSEKFNDQDKQLIKFDRLLPEVIVIDEQNWEIGNIGPLHTSILERLPSDACH